MEEVPLIASAIIRSDVVVVVVAAAGVASDGQDSREKVTKQLIMLLEAIWETM